MKIVVCVDEEDLKSIMIEVKVVDFFMMMNVIEIWFDMKIVEEIDDDGNKVEKIF